MDKLTNLMVTQKEFSNLVGVSSRTIRNKITEGMPSKGRRGLPFYEAFRWWMENVIGGGEGETLTDLRKEKFRIENELRKIELLIKKGELLSRAEVVQHNVGIIYETRAALLALNRTLSAKLIGLEPREMADIIRKEVVNLLNKFHKGITRGVKVK